jgi:uncharacterized protein (DUF305 family)
MQVEGGTTRKRLDVRETAQGLFVVMLLAGGCGTSSQPVVPYDLRFIDAMVVHHQAAIDMSLPAESSALRAELKDFARKVVADQSREVELMKGWREQWYPGKPETPTIMGMPGMESSMRGMDPRHMQGLKGDAYDRMYVNMMIPHHQGAIVMAEDALTKSQRPEIRKLAQSIIDAQSAEIDMMNGWKATWAQAESMPGM